MVWLLTNAWYQAAAAGWKNWKPLINISSLKPCVMPMRREETPEAGLKMVKTKRWANSRNYSWKSKEMPGKICGLDRVDWSTKNTYKFLFQAESCRDTRWRNRKNHIMSLWWSAGVWWLFLYFGWRFQAAKIRGCSPFRSLRLSRNMQRRRAGPSQQRSRDGTLGKYFGGFTRTLFTLFIFWTLLS